MARIPKGRLGRLVKLATVSARSGASLAASGSGEAAAQYAAAVLGELRGLAAKVGQMASYVDGMVPEHQRAAYEASMSALRAAAPTSSVQAIREQIETELGAPIEELFASFEDEPFASASIGQVHRGQLQSGQLVAVKVQHPGIERAVVADLDNAAMVQALVGKLAPKGLDPAAYFRELRERFLEELDYELEARHQKFFAELHADDPSIVVPEVIDSHSSRRVLTSELVAGETLEQLQTRSAAERAQAAATLWRYVFKGNLVGSKFNADPHPGNYLFQDEGRVAFVDYGCVQPIGPERNVGARKLHVAALRGDREAFRAATIELLGTQGGEYEDVACAYVRDCFKPIFASPYLITRDYVAGLVHAVQDMKSLLFKKGARVVPLPEGMLFMNRLQFGFYSVLARLEVEVDYGAVEAQFLSEAGLL